MPYKIHHSLVGLCKCWVKILRKKLMKNENTICWLKTVYDDNIIKWPLKHRKSIEKLWQKLSLEWYSRRTVLIGWVENSLDAFVASWYSRNRAFRSIWWLIQRIYCNIKVPSVKNGCTKCAWGRNNWTVREGGFRSCHCLRSFSSMRRVGGAELSLKVNEIF